MNQLSPLRSIRSQSLLRRFLTLLLVSLITSLLFFQIATRVSGSPQQTWTSIARFQSMDLGPVDGQNEWSGVGDIIVDPNDATNQVLQISGDEGMLTKNLGLTLSPEAQTIFFRVYRTDAIAFQAGGGISNPVSGNPAFQAQVGSSVSGSEDSFGVVDGESESKFFPGFDANQWHCVWIQTNLSENSYNVIVQKEGSNPTQLIDADDAVFTYKVPTVVGALNEFWVEIGEFDGGPNSGEGLVFIDDIFHITVQENSPPFATLCPTELPPTTPAPTTPPPTTAAPTTPPPTTPAPTTPAPTTVVPTDTFTPTPTFTATLTDTPTVTPTPTAQEISLLSLPMILLNTQISPPDSTATPQSCLTAEIEPNNISANATVPVCFDQVVRGILTPGSDETDIYLVELDQDSDLRITLSNMPAGHNYILTLFDEVGALVAQVGNRDEVKIIDLTEMVAGSYYVLVAYDSGPGSGDAYHLTVSAD